MIVRWQVDDGYAGGERPQSTEIDDEDLANLETDTEREDFIHDSIQEDFENKISWTKLK